ncbi:7TM diverse intracellular signaling [Marinomonas aquimarina]|uniref:7TM diverse intracellular signaling n=1 Tax=Marinomonas aquimarina TaxID=295068 RepID=A0A1A8T639_9GAMM|nr:7TM diverse intracellular signaling domain-containing protein [Marinomonas aquimarina]SBS26508.1 7TM diverse intracellular signaling [Marinomonas aquimarina]
MIKHSIQTLILLAIMLLTNIAYSAPMMALLDEENHSVNIGNVGSYFIDETSRLTLRDIDSEVLRKRFVPLKHEFPQFGLVEGNIWIRVEVAQRLPTGESAALHIKAPRAQVVDVYTPNLLNNQIFAEMGDARPYRNRLIAYPDYIVPLPSSAPPLYTVYIKVSSRLPINLIMEVKTLSQLTNDIQKDTYLTGFLMGVLLLLFASNVFFFIRTRHPMYLLYSTLLVGIACLHFALHGFVYQIFPNLMGLQERVYNFSALACAAMITYFTRYYIDTKETLPQVDKLLLLLILGNGFLAVIYALAPEELNIAFLSISAVSTLVLLLFVALYSVYKRIPYAFYYLTARLVLTLGHSIWILSTYGVLSLPFWYEWGLTTSIILEALVHFGGIISRHTPTHLNTAKGEDVPRYELLSEVASRIKRQTSIIDHQYNLNEPNADELKQAYKNLTNIAERLTIIQSLQEQNNHDRSNVPTNLQLLIDQATIDFFTLDQSDAEIDMQYDNTFGWELLANSHIVKHLYQVIMEELHHHTDQTLNVESDVIINERDGQRLLQIRAYPIPSSVTLEKEQYFGPRYLRDLVEALQGEISISGEGRARALSCSIPVNIRQVEVSELAKQTQQENIILVIIGHQDSDLIERTSNFLHTRLFALTHIDSVTDLHSLLNQRNGKSRFVILLFEDQKNFGASDLAGFVSELHETDSCLLISNNVNMSQEYASALGFNGFVYSSQIETRLLADIEQLQREASNSMLPRIKRYSQST